MRPTCLAMWVALAFGGAACDDTPAPEARAPAPAPPAPSTAKLGEIVDAPSVIEASTYRLALSAVDGASEGEQAFEVSLAGVGDWHVNTDYPISVAVAADEGIAIPKAELDRGDAAELSDDVARFMFVASAGDGAPEVSERRVNALVRFAMCTPSSCTFHDEVVGAELVARGPGE